jgi:hypothetical protein
VADSTATGENGAGSASHGGRISDNGRYVVFPSDIPNLVPNDANGVVIDVFVKDLVTGAVGRVSVSNTNVDGDDRSFEPATSADGRYVAFSSSATNLVSGDTNGEQDVFVTGALTLEGAPTTLTAQAVASNRVDLAWTDNTVGEAGFEIWASTDGGPLALVGTSVANRNVFRHTGLTGNHTVAYQVRAFTSPGGLTDFSNIATAVVIGQPLGLNAQALDTGRIQVTWNDNATNETRTEIWRKVGSGEWALLRNSLANTQRYTDITVSANQTYSYRVRCTNGVHVSSFTNEDTSPAMLAPPGWPATRSPARGWTSPGPITARR